MQKTFIDIAKNDLQYLQQTLGEQSYFFNQNAVNAQQICEKYLKGFIELHCTDLLEKNEMVSLLWTHNLRKLQP